MTVKRWDVVVSDDLDTFKELINQKLKTDWLLYGEHKAAYDSQAMSIEYTQAFVKYE